MSQNDQILNLLRKGPLTPIDALNLAGIFRLAARVMDLRSQGHVISTERVTKNGKTFAQYQLIKEAVIHETV